jgi:Ca-activated chloride channel homolog
LGGWTHLPPTNESHVLAECKRNQGTTIPFTFQTTEEGNTMKPAKIFTAILTLLFGVSAAKAMSVPPKPDDPNLIARLNTPYISSSGGTVYLQLTYHGPRGKPHTRQPLNLSVVLDRSGSMADQGKIDFAKSALYRLIDQLGSEDILSVVIYDNEIEVLQQARRVHDKRELKSLIAEVYPRNSTNLGGGMIEGFHQVERNASHRYVNRVILLSDGLANQGITSSYELGRIARTFRSQSISLTTMGVGLDYNEDLMVSLAENGGGNYYFIEHPRSLAGIFENEFSCLSQLLAHNCQIELVLGDGVQISDIVGYSYDVQAGKCIISLGDLYYGEERELTVELRVPEGKGSRRVASGDLRLGGTAGSTGNGRGFAADINYTKDQAVVERHRDLETQSRADVAVSTRKVERALELLDKGKTEEAMQSLGEAKSALTASPAAAANGPAGAAVQSQLEALEGYEKTMQDSKDQPNRAKKSIQYDNYRTQKNKK